jgi:hypothetical protein
MLGRDLPISAAKHHDLTAVVQESSSNSLSAKGGEYPRTEPQILRRHFQAMDVPCNMKLVGTIYICNVTNVMHLILACRNLLNCTYFWEHYLRDCVTRLIFFEGSIKQCCGSAFCTVYDNY